MFYSFMFRSTAETDAAHALLLILLKSAQVCSSLLKGLLKSAQVCSSLLKFVECNRQL